MNTISNKIRSKLIEDDKRLRKFIDKMTTEEKNNIKIVNISCGICNYDCKKCGVDKM